MAGRVDETRQLVIPARVHGRVLVAGADDPAAPLLVGFHGYGENAEHQLRALEAIPGIDGWRLAAVEALHPFYNRHSREVVASWMTQRLRERAIEDNVGYVLDALRALIELGQPACLAVAGFSQGVAMAYRAAAALSLPGSFLRPDALVVLAGDVPPDVAARAPALPPILLGRGSDDDWYTAEKLAQDLDVLRRLERSVETCTFAGGHVWSPEFLARAGAFLARRAENLAGD